MITRGVDSGHTEAKGLELDELVHGRLNTEVHKDSRPASVSLGVRNKV